MQAITDSFTQNCNCYPLLLQKCSTIKNSQLSSRFNLKDLSVALLFITFHTLFSFQGAIVVYTNSISLAATQALLLAHFVVSPLRFTNASLVCESSQNLTILILLRPDANVPFLKRFHLFSKAFRLLLSGGDSRDRTGDLLLARQALSQLSYIPLSSLLKKSGGPEWARTTDLTIISRTL